MTKKIWSILMVLLLFPVLIFAETIVLKSGKTVEGNLIEKTDKSITVDFQGVPITYYNSEVESINGVKQELPSIKEINNGEVSKDFVDNLILRNIGNHSIMIPNFLIENEKNQNTDELIGKVFQDISKTKSILVLIDKTPLSEDLKQVVSSQYDFHDKAFNPGINPIYKVWNKVSYEGRGKTSRIDFGDFHGFLIKGTAKFGYRYELFKKGEDETLISIVIRSPNDYFLSDGECNYIVNTLRENKKKE